MAKVADVKLGWTRSPTADVTSRKITITKNGEETVIDLGPETSDYTLEVPALGVVQFKTEVMDTEGKVATTETYSFTLGDLEDPQPDFNLFHEVLSVRDVPDEPSGTTRAKKARD